MPPKYHQFNHHLKREELMNDTIVGKQAVFNLEIFDTKKVDKQDQYRLWGLRRLYIDIYGMEEVN